MKKMTMEERADALELQMSQELDKIAVRSAIYDSGERDPTEPLERPPQPEGRYFLMSQDKRLPEMPGKPTLIDFFRFRLAPASHLLQSAALARKNGLDEKIVLACLLHDISILGFIRSDHGYWGAQLVEPYVDQEVAWAIRYHQALRFYPDESAGYAYPEMYRRLFGEDYRPEPHVDAAYRYARNHKWYMSARLITLNDLYAFDPDTTVDLDEFTDIIGRHFRQPNEGLGFDDSPASHMWRTINWPTRFL